MKVIGITGPSGAGKSVFADFCRQKAYTVLDADAVYHTIIIPPSPCLDELKNTFGDEILNEDGSLCRRRMAEIVFSDKTHEKQLILNKITHKYVLNEIRREILNQKETGAAFVFVDAPLLMESGFNCECDAVISVLAEPALRVARIMERDRITKEDAQKRIDAQPNDSFYETNSDYVIYNNGTLEYAVQSVKNVLSKMGVPL